MHLPTPFAAELLVLIFKAARCQRRLNLTALCERRRKTFADLDAAFEQLAQRGLISFGPQGERLTLPGLALAADLARRMTRQHRPLASCRHLAA